MSERRKEPNMGFADRKKRRVVHAAVGHWTEAATCGNKAFRVTLTFVRREVTCKACLRRLNA